MEKKFKIINSFEADAKFQNDNNYIYPTPKTSGKSMIIPDFSPILIQETQFGFKTNGSYKRKKIEEPESPIKMNYKKYSTPSKIEGRDLFNIKNLNSHCRKLDFKDEEEKIEKSKEIIPKINNNFCFNIFGQTFINNIMPDIKQNKMENEYSILKTLQCNKLDYVYKVKEKRTGKNFCIKKIYKNSSKNNINNLLNLFNDMKNKKINNKNNTDINKDYSNLGKDFCNHFKDCWIEEENSDIIYPDSFLSEKYLYILYNFYQNGDLLDYLEKLEKIEYIFTPDFYWDIIFEMLMGLKYIHELGYLHLDVKPTNFLVDEKGFLKLTDFGLCHKISEISFLADIIEGDKVYISKEFFNFNSRGILNTKTDIFSLGLSILEIIAKIDLPSSGNSWAEIRSDNFTLKESLFEHCNVRKNREDFIKLISQMIAPLDKRVDIHDLINNFEELNKRYLLLKQNNYKKSVDIPQINNINYCTGKLIID